MIPRAQKMVAIFWPSFVMAGVATMLLFAAFDPHEMTTPGWFANLSRLEAYTVGFLFFWALMILNSILTCHFQKPENRIRSRRPD